MRLTIEDLEVIVSACHEADDQGNYPAASEVADKVQDIIRERKRKS